MNLEIRKYEENDLERIHELNKEEGWTNLVEKMGDTREAWKHSNIAYVIEDEDGVIGYIRGMTDTRVSLYICELLIDKKYRGQGFGKRLLQYVHDLYPRTRMELLASSSSHTYYEGNGHRPFYGFRKTYEE
ncbi:GNAT family N-acetyltransferase [Bacillaceae bacterium S4-13-58]